VPIDIEEFEAVPDGRERSTSELIVEFLFENSDAAFTRSEIAEAVERDPNTVGTNLSRLKDRGLVRHRGNYWAITDDTDRLVSEIRHADSLTRLADSLGPTITSEADAEAWSDAQPDREHPSESERRVDDSDSSLDSAEEADD
jgi:Mn-dependent DtxR family transcriptional regulator